MSQVPHSRPPGHHRLIRHLALAASLLVPLGQRVAAQSTQDALFQDLRWRNIGPANMAGRVTDIEAVESDFTTVYVGAASGGVWKSVNAGTTWEPIFEDYGTANIGDIAIFQPNPDIVWVGTGESCTRNSVGWGDGVYKSTDGGETFVNMGLRDTHHIGEVITHPSDPDIVYVAAQGHLWGYTGERGLYRTRDGGDTWELLGNGLPDDGRTGATDIKMDPSDPNVLYVAFWERLRQPYRFDSGGPNGGIFKSTDGGDTWAKLTNGLPEGDTGKIGISVSRQNPNIVMAIVEHGYQPQASRGSRGNRGGGAASPEYADMSRLGSGIYRSEDGGESWEFINRYNNRPFYYSHIYIDPNDAEQVYVLAGRANVSEDGGRSFSRNMVGISGDFHALWVHPNNPDIFYVGNDKGSYVTYDRGMTFTMFDNMDIGQFYAVTADNRDPYWVYGGLQDNGNWGGPSNSRDWNGILNDHWFKFHSGDGFHTTPDPNDWRTVYTESQGGNLRRLDAVFRQVGQSITPARNNILNLTEFYADLTPVAAPSGGEFGVRGGGENRLPRDRFRFNWSSPLILSPHKSTTIYFGGNHLFKSMDRGDTWRIISPDLSTNDPVLTNEESGGLTRDVTRAETHATLITISESPITPGLIWAGTDDGRVQLTRDDGGSWTDVRRNIEDVPMGLWVSRVTASRFDESTAYLTFDGHRSDDFRPWVLKTTDFGASWESISSNLPTDEPVYVITEDPHNRNLLFVGTEFGAYVTVNGGGTWSRLMADLPTVAIHDLVVHPRDGDLIAATHGRSIWILDDITPLQQLDDDILSSPIHLFESRVATQWKGISRGGTRGHKLFTGRNPLTIEQAPPGNSPTQLLNSAAIHYYVGADVSAPITLEISDLAGENIFTTDVPVRRGINRYYWGMRFNPTQQQSQAFRRQQEEFGAPFGGRSRFSGQAQGTAATPGTYRVEITGGGETRSGTLTIRADPALVVTTSTGG
ncbi:MAG: hypothetical protein BMS9Abin29_1092 [Gemmatimonadota bacterium]|nr:MAG: hypothetical protein BMS9Abin29_1092 [Gemmatimonadota bacterium]